MAKSSNLKRHSAPDQALLERLVEWCLRASAPTSAGTTRLISDLLMRPPWATWKADLADAENRAAIEHFHLELGGWLWRHVNMRHRIVSSLMPVELPGLMFYARPGPAKDGGLRPPSGRRREREPLFVVEENAVELDIVVHSSNLRDVLWFQVLNVLQGAGGSRLGRCDCERLFVKVGKRRFCSTRCQRRVLMRAIRARQRAELADVLKGGQRGKTRKR